MKKEMALVFSKNKESRFSIPDTEHSVLMHCLVEARKDQMDPSINPRQKTMFHFVGAGKGDCIVHLCGYKIVPRTEKKK